MFKVVMVGADDSATARRAVEAATDIASNYGSTLHIVTAYERGTSVPSGAPAEFANVRTKDDGEATLQSLSFIAKNRDVEPVLHSVKGDAAEGLLKLAQAFKVDLLVVGNRGMRGIHRVLGSVPNTVAHGALCSVLIVDTVDKP